MKQNVGDVDATMRYVLSVVFILLGFTVSYWWFVPALIMLATGFFGWCGLYTLLGINTCKTKELPNVSVPSTTNPVHETALDNSGQQIEKMFSEFEKMYAAPTAKPTSAPKKSVTKKKSSKSKSKPKKVAKKAAPKKKPARKKK